MDGIEHMSYAKYLQQRYDQRKHARQTIFEYIQVWYNHQRRYSALGYLSPEQYEQVVA